MRSLCALLVSLAGARALHVLHESSTPCTEPRWDTGQARMYNLAFAMADRRALQDWAYVALARPAPGVERSCVNVSYVSAFNSSRLLLYADLSRIAVQKTVCVSGRDLHERSVISNIPLAASAEVSVSAEHLAQGSVRVAARFETSTPWVLTLVESAVADYVRGYLAKYVDLLTSGETVCASAPAARKKHKPPDSREAAPRKTKATR